MTIRYRVNGVLLISMLLLTCSVKASYSSSTDIHQKYKTDESIKNQLTNQFEQEKVRRRELQPGINEIFSVKTLQDKIKIYFPEEKICHYIKKIIIRNNNGLELNSLAYFTEQAQGKCLGEKSLLLLTHLIQGEIIRMGYITTRVHIPEQNLNEGTLRFLLIPEKPLKIRYPSSNECSFLVFCTNGSIEADNTLYIDAKAKSINKTVGTIAASNMGINTSTDSLPAGALEENTVTAGAPRLARIKNPAGAGFFTLHPER